MSNCFKTKFIYKFIVVFSFIISKSIFLFAAINENSNAFNNFYPHLTAPSRTVGSGKWTFQPTAGYSLETGSLLLNNLSYGINHRFEIGTVPIFFANRSDEIKTYPITFKVSLFESDNIDFGFTLTYIKFNFKLNVEPTSTTNNNSSSGANATQSNNSSIGQNRKYLYDVTYQVPQYNLVWRADSKNQVGINLAYKFYTVRVETENNKPREVNIGADFFIDYLHSPGNQMHYGIGYSRSHDLFNMPKEGAGFSITQSRNGKFFSSPRIGVHHYNDGENQLLISTSFY